jgi:hypothetical protein
MIIIRQSKLYSIEFVKNALFFERTTFQTRNSESKCGLLVSDSITMLKVNWIIWSFPRHFILTNFFLD